ncbi:coiled-coil domain-containing protein 32 isoform X2 [Tachysurus fulvidraco]|uniref:coiled-coil domain-containing protein 32 isoform X2 n=1 Tax=Tachysurus fulvidraco TaxID=1234273 RepID=UPI001FEDD835|nr:coiled-coil domain-containing protein 32 isoform X2 [Tachysurus fulvidraco]XP_047677336.1 coiled-coil domain-containing protein 32 isoform X2 [Tachysurus fulvidraco]
MNSIITLTKLQQQFVTNVIPRMIDQTELQKKDMTDDSKSVEIRSSGDLWSEICSDLPEPVEHGTTDEHFTDSFQPQCPVSNQSSFIPPSNLTSSSQWEPMADSAVYIASLENRLKRIKGQSNEVTSREMLRSLSQAKKECWDRFLHDAQTSELFQEGDLDQRQVRNKSHHFVLLWCSYGALEQLKRWFSPERVAISAEELEYLLFPSKSRESAPHHPSSIGYSTEELDEEECSSPEK